MSITIQLLTLLGSKLKAESVYGKGSKFYFELEQKIVDHTPIVCPLRSHVGQIINEAAHIVLYGYNLHFAGIYLRKIQDIINQ